MSLVSTATMENISYTVVSFIHITSTNKRSKYFFLDVSLCKINKKENTNEKWIPFNVKKRPKNEFYLKRKKTLFFLQNNEFVDWILAKCELQMNSQAISTLFKFQVDSLMRHFDTTFVRFLWLICFAWNENQKNTLKFSWKFTNCFFSKSFVWVQRFYFSTLKSFLCHVNSIFKQMLW